MSQFSGAESREEVLARLDRRFQRLEQGGWRTKKPPTPPRDSVPANWAVFLAITVPAFYAAWATFQMAFAERPGALLFLWAVMVTSAASLGIMFRQTISDRPGTYDEPWLRWFSAVGLTAAMILGGGAALMVAGSAVKMIAS